ncbi:hypothetical protein C8R43DRAFT_1121028 [Mycena crocata]|nr:hypothetical protein C8R43DRAFT_1121028 [Mycena crocata]
MSDSDDEHLVASALLLLNSDWEDDVQMNPSSDLTVYEAVDPVHKTLPEPKTLTEIDAEEESEDDSCAAYGNCDFCHQGLGPKAPVPCRFFRCWDCPSVTYCENCCYEKHICKTNHRLEEWSHKKSDWFECTLAETGLQDKYQMNCISCWRVNASWYFQLFAMPRWTAVQDLLPRGSRRKAIASPVWKGNRRGWEPRSLRDIGFVYQMGHHGQPCPVPMPYISQLAVIDMGGPQWLPLRYCGCGKYAEGVRGRWQQITKEGWHPSGLDHLGTCTTFPVCSPTGIVRVFSGGALPDTP